MIIGEFCDVYPPQLDGVGTVVRLAQDDLVQQYHRVRRNQDLVRLQRAVEAVRLAAGHQGGHFIVRGGGIEPFLEVVEGIYFKINIQARKQLPPTRGVACQDDPLAVQFHQYIFR